MTTVKIKMPESVEVTRRNGASVAVAIADLPEASLANLLVYGIRQKINDSASGHPDAKNSETAMNDAVSNLIAGEWSIRKAAAESDPLDRHRVKIVREILAQPTNASVKAKYDAIDSSDQAARREFIMELAAKFADHIDPIAQKRFDAEQKAKEAASGLSFEL